MKANPASVIKFLQAPQQFSIPIYQRTYSWTEKQCEQMWDDITDVAARDIPSHFIGSIVYIGEGPFQPTAVSHLQVIDGQQRLTTLTLLLAALARAIEGGGCSEISTKQIQNYYLFNNDEVGRDRYKLILTQSDRDTLISIIEKRQIPKEHSENLVNNFRYFQDRIAKGGFDPDTIWRGIKKLAIVDISLEAGDKPQIIFESLNSTGLDLSKTDLIRNYLLMGLERDVQERIYVDFWQPLEEGFKKNPQEFDNFIKDYLTIKTGQIPVVRDVYPVFKEYARGRPIEELASDIYRLARFYTRLAFEDEPDAELNQTIRNINALKIDAPYPFLIEVYADCTDRDGSLVSRGEVLETFRMVECYLFRRAICDVPTNSLGKTFASLADRIDKARRVESLKAAFQMMDGYRRLPTDKEFESRLVSKDVYNTVRIRKHLLDRLENHGRKERVNVNEYTIEHIMPQNNNLSQEWRNMLGPDWKEIQDEYLHTLGNLTLTGHNPELGDRPFLEKRDIEGGFAGSPIRLNRGLAKLGRWGRPEILERGRSLAKKATEVWPYPHLPQDVLERYTKMDEDDDPEDDDHPEPRWEHNWTRASAQVRDNIDRLVSQIHQRFDCVEEPYSWWLMFYVRKPAARKTLFALLDCGRNTANAAFRIDPDTFEASVNTRKVAGWFFPAGTERRIKLTADNASEVMGNLEHAHDATVRALDIRRDR